MLHQEVVKHLLGFHGRRLFGDLGVRPCFSILKAFVVISPKTAILTLVRGHWNLNFECIIVEVGFSSSKRLPFGVGNLDESSHGRLRRFEDRVSSCRDIRSRWWLPCTRWWSGGHCMEPNVLKGVESGVGRKRDLACSGFWNLLCSQVSV